MQSSKRVRRSVVDDVAQDNPLSGAQAQQSVSRPPVGGSSSLLTSFGKCSGRQKGTCAYLAHKKRNSVNSSFPCSASNPPSTSSIRTTQTDSAQSSTGAGSDVHFYVQSHPSASCLRRDNVASEATPRQSHIRRAAQSATNQSLGEVTKHASISLLKLA
jgi:hypothetical protein